MPMVGGKEYPYTKAGMAAAKKQAKKSGKPMKMKKTAADKAAMKGKKKK
jgi:hypothetical protein